MPTNSTMVFGDKPETHIYKSSSLSTVVNHVLLGTRLDVLDSTSNAYKVSARGLGRSGWVKKTDVRDSPVLKVFFVDVGQGDGAIIESPEGIVLIDGGPNKNLYKFCRSRYWRLIREQGKVHIKALIVSHPDWDHFNGLTNIINDPDFTIGNIYHNGIIRYDTKPTGVNSYIGKTQVKTIDGKSKEVLTDTFSTLDQAQNLLDEGHLMSSFTKFWKAAIEAKADGRLSGNAKRLTIYDDYVPAFEEADELTMKVLAPVPTSAKGSKTNFPCFPEAEDIAKDNPNMSESHTINGNSLVLRLEFGDHKILMGGDLNIPAELYLLEHYGDDNPFRVDVAKACHHGSSDYLVDYLKQVRPIVNVVSSGDNKTYDHPMSDSVGASCRHTRGDHPLFFSTEIARAQSSSGIHYGLINLRSNGDTLVMAQMKEVHKGIKDVWDSYTIPWHGQFHEEIKGFKENN